MKKLIFLLSFIMTISVFGNSVDKHESNNKDGTKIEKSQTVDIVKSCDNQLLIQNTIDSGQGVGVIETKVKSQMKNQEATIIKKAWKNTPVKDKVPKKSSNEFSKHNQRTTEVFGTSGGNPGYQPNTTI